MTRPADVPHALRVYPKRASWNLFNWGAALFSKETHWEKLMRQRASRR